MQHYRAVLAVVVIINIAAVLRLVTIHAASKMPYLMAFLVCQFCQGIATLVVPVNSAFYQTLYYVTEPLNWVFYILVIWEMYQMAFASFRGIAGIAKWAVHCSIACALVISVLMLSMTNSYEINRRVLLGYLLNWEKCVCFALTVFVVFMIFILSRYPVSLSANLKASIGIFTVYFLGNFAALQLSTADTLFLQLIRNYLMLVLEGGCFLAWGVALRKSAAAWKPQERVMRDPLEEQRLLAQLANLNNMLLKSARQ